jgi:hypothetical protein
MVCSLVVYGRHIYPNPFGVYNSTCSNNLLQGDQARAHSALGLQHDQPLSRQHQLSALYPNENTFSFLKNQSQWYAV